MKQDELRSIMREFYGSPLSFLEVEDGETRIKMKKPVGQAAVEAAAPISVDTPVEDASEKKTAGADGHVYRVKAPLVGVYYEAPSPDDDPFVRQGPHVEEGDTLCIIAAMKMMNDVKAPKAGIVRWIAVQNGATVGFDDLLMEIEAD